MPGRDYEGDELSLFARATNWKAYWASVVSPYVGARVLDVGAGIGATARALAGVRPSHWTALEPDPGLCASIETSVADGSLPSHVVPLNGTLADIADGERFDTILYVDVLEHIADDRQELQEAAKRLDVGGHLIVVSPAHQWLYSPFDRAIGHHRRYSRRSLLALKPDGLCTTRLVYLDSVGLLASLANRCLLRASMPTQAQIATWDGLMVPASRWIDGLLLHRVGKTVVAVFSRDDDLR
jgi:SAM-dependent methyltransferase